MPAACSLPAEGADDPRALRQRLRVAGVQGGMVRLQADRLSGCAACAARAGCGAGALADLVEAGPLEISLPDTGGIAPGDKVIVTLPGGAFLGAAGLAYLVPPLALVLGAAGFSALGLGNLATALACLPVLALSLLPARLAERRGRLAAAMTIEAVIPAPSRAAR